MAKKISRNISALTVFILLICINVSAQDTVKIMSYNLLNYSGGETKNRNFRKTLPYANPDILAVCEMVSQAGVNDLLANVLNYNTPGLYTAGTFIDGPDTDNAIFFKTSKFTFLGNTAVPTDLRNISLFTLVHNLSHDTIRIFEVHLKASNGTADQEQRLSEVNSMRAVTNTFAFGTEFLVMGDFNIYTSNEACYSRMLQVDSARDGHFIDNYNLPGTWNQAQYSQYHSQSTRTRNLGDGGATGGMDDRFDFILNSRALTEEGRIKYIPFSLKPLGNDGNHYNDSINKRPNTSVPDSVADGLHYGSDHLPVTALYKFDMHPTYVAGNQESAPEIFTLEQNFPNPFNPSTVITYELKQPEIVSLQVFDADGRKVRELVSHRQNAGKYRYEFNASSLPSGVYFYRLRAGSFSKTRAMILVR